MIALAGNGLFYADPFAGLYGERRCLHDQLAGTVVIDDPAWVG